MTIEHELTAPDMKNCRALLRGALSGAPAGTVAIALTAYAVGGALLLGWIFDLSPFEQILLLAFSAGLGGLTVVALKLAASNQLSKHPGKDAMKRRYRLTDNGLEIWMPDLTQCIPFGRIERLEAGAHGSLVHLATSSPIFLPFGSSYREDFVGALRAKIEERN